MARDFDFKRRPSAPSAQPVPVRPKITAALPKNPSSQKLLEPPKKLSWLVYLTVIIVVGVAVYLYYRSLQEPVTGTNTTTSSAETSPATTAKTALTIKLYDGGAGQNTLDAVAKTLENKGYQVEKLGKSQFEYDQTYVWFTKEFSSDAQTISKLLVGRTVTLKESQVSGAFAVQIQLGKK